MDLTSAISGLQQSQALGAVQIKVAQMILSEAQSQGSAEVQLIQAANAGMTNSADAVVAASNGLGGQIDTHA